MDARLSEGGIMTADAVPDGHTFLVDGIGDYLVWRRRKKKKRALYRLEGTWDQRKAKKKKRRGELQVRLKRVSAKLRDECKAKRATLLGLLDKRYIR